MEWIVPVSVAVIGGPLMWALHRFDRRNTYQHGENLTMLSKIEKKIEKIDDRIHEHITWHGQEKE